jgi:hypothetical protein
MEEAGLFDGLQQAVTEITDRKEKRHLGDGAFCFGFV